MPHTSNELNLYFEGINSKTVFKKLDYPLTGAGLAMKPVMATVTPTLHYYYIVSLDKKNY